MAAKKAARAAASGGGTSTWRSKLRHIREQQGENSERQGTSSPSLARRTCPTVQLHARAAGAPDPPAQQRWIAVLWPVGGCQHEHQAAGAVGGSGHLRCSNQSMLDEILGANKQLTAQNMAAAAAAAPATATAAKRARHQCRTPQAVQSVRCECCAVRCAGRCVPCAEPTWMSSSVRTRREDRSSPVPDLQPSRRATECPLSIRNNPKHKCNVRVDDFAVAAAAAAHLPHVAKQQELHAWPACRAPGCPPHR